MEQKERATVIIRRNGGNEDRLRQAIVDGLVRKEVQRDIEQTLFEAEETRRYAEHMEAQAEVARQRADQAQAHVGSLQRQIAEMQRDAQYRAQCYREAERAYEREKKRTEKRRKIAMIVSFTLIAICIGVIADTIGRIIFKAIFG